MKVAIQAVYAIALFLTIGAAPAAADLLYTNGPINGTIGAPGINSIYSVSDSFVLSTAASVTGVNFGAWVLDGYTVSAVDWSIGSSAYSDSSASGSAPTTDTPFSTIAEYTVYELSFSVPSISLGPGTYWLTLSGAVGAPSGDAAWDINNGPSTAFVSSIGNAANYFDPGTDSNSFQVVGSATPEPGSWCVLAMSVVGLALGILRRREQFGL